MTVAVLQCPTISDATVASANWEVAPQDLQDRRMQFLTEDMLEAFYTQGINDEFLVAQATSEARTFGLATKTSDGTVLPPDIRRITLTLMHRMVMMQSLEIDRLYEMATLFDLYCLRCEKDADELQGSLPVLVGAILRLVAKHHNQCACVDGVILELGAQFKKVLAGNYGVSVCSPSIVAVNRMELEVLEATNWKVIMPTVHWWSVAIMGRFAAVTRQRDLASLTWMWQHHTQVKQAELLQIIKPSELAPRHLAVGLFVLGLVRANLLPISVVFPDEDDDARKHFLSNQVEGTTCLMGGCDDRYTTLIQQVELATGAPFVSIREHCRAIMSFSICPCAQFGVSAAGA